jgi:hypothetical protein
MARKAYPSDVTNAEGQIIEHLAIAIGSKTLNTSPSSVKIHLITTTPLGTLIVFYSDAHCWQFRVLSSRGEVKGLSQIFYTPQAAERAGREWIV